MSKRLCAVYRGSKDSTLYLYVDHVEGLARVPPELLQRLGKPVLAMTLALTVERKLANASAPIVLQAIETQGFYLQMPPVVDGYTQAIRQANDKL